MAILLVDSNVLLITIIFESNLKDHDNFSS